MACRISLTASSKRTIDELTAQFEQWTNNDWKNTKIGRVCEALMSESVSKAYLLYSEACNAVAGTTDHKTMPSVDQYEWVGNNVIQFKAHGKDVLFLEFGTGLVGLANSERTEDYPMDTSMDVVFVGGSYSKSHERYLYDPNKIHSFKGAWPVANGQFAHGSNPAKAMYEAEKYFRENLKTELEKIFK